MTPERPRLVEEQEAKLRALMAMLNASIAEGGDFTDDDVTAAIDAKAAEMARQVSEQAVQMPHGER